MRVGIDLLFIQPGRNRGTETYVHGLLKRLSERPGLDLVLFTNELNHGRFEGIGNSCARLCGISGAGRVRRVAYQQAVIPRLARDAGCDLLFCPGYLAPIWSRVPVVVTVPDTQFLDVPTSVSLGQWASYHAIVPRSVRRARAVITISNFSKRRIVEALKIEATKVFVTALAPKNFNPGGSNRAGERAFTERHGLSRPYFLSVSNRYPHKNIPGLMRSFIKFKEQTRADIDLVFVGSKPGGEEFAVGAGERNDIKFLGYIGDEELEIAYRLSCGFVLASFYEGFGLPVLEAMGQGVPVACSNAASLPEVVGDAALLFDPNSEQSMVGALKKLHTDLEECGRLVTAGRANVARFSWDRCADETHHVFLHCLG